MSNSSRDIEDAHNRGQADGSRNKYDPPVPINPLDRLIYPDDAVKDWDKLNESYDKGWKHGYD